MKIKEKLQSFIKSMGGEEPGNTSSPENEPAQGEPAQDIPDELLEKVQMAIEAGELEISEEALKTWCGENGFTPEQTQMLWDILSGNIEPDATGEEPEPNQEPEPSTPIEKSGVVKDTELKDFAKSLSVHAKDISRLENAVGSLIDENQRLRGEMKVQKETSDKEISFLKSKLGIMEKTPANPKTVVTDPNHILPDMNKAEIKKLLFKGAQEGKIAIGDFTEFDVNGVQTNAAKLFLKSIGGQN